MLGKLFSTAASTLTPRAGSTSPSRAPAALDSVLEDTHTRNLLFPDGDALSQHQHDQVFPLTAAAAAAAAVSLPPSSTQAFDLNPDVDMDLRDVRVVILQEATATQSAALLFDSHPLRSPSPSPSPPPSGPGSRRVSLGQAPPPPPPVVVTHESPPPRSPGAFDRRPSAYGRGAGSAETDGQRSAREYREEMTAVANCVFGSSDVMAFKGTGTKLHILPAESRAAPAPADGVGALGSLGPLGSLGRAAGRSSRLAQSCTVENTPPPPRGSKKALVTRIFPVVLPSADAAAPGGARDRKPRQTRTPMYAIGLIVQLPAAAAAARFRGPGSGSDVDHESYPSSLGSSHPSAWTVLGNGAEPPLSSPAVDADDRMDALTQHWDIVRRTLSHLQAAVARSVLDLLRQADTASPDPLPPLPPPPPPPSAHAAASVSVAAKPPKSNAKLVQLAANALFQRPGIAAEVDGARQRIVSGIKTLPVVTRQGRWGIWREEARWACRWAAARSDERFLYRLLTGFLGCHTEWLQALAPDAYRRHYGQQNRGPHDDDAHVAARTIVVAHDKMAARRLLFLLASFLPPSQRPPAASAARACRPGTAASFGAASSQSPPSYVPSSLREESLRRTAQRRAGPARRLHTRTLSFPSAPTADDRRLSDAAAPKTARLPLPGADGSSRKSGAAAAATTAAVAPAATATVPHFSTRRAGRGVGRRPGSSGSVAADDLFRALTRGDSAASSDSLGYSRWGSVISGFWGGRRPSATSADATPPSLESLAPGLGAAAADVAPAAVVYAVLPPLPPARLAHAPREPRLAHPAGAYESPVKTSINDDDGVIDIDVPLPDYLTSSFGSAFSSPSSSGCLSTHGVVPPGPDGFDLLPRAGPDADAPLNVGGWLPHFHPDFVLQAIPAQDRLDDEVRAALRAEPTPPLSPARAAEKSRWVDVGCALIADATRLSVRRIRYRRLLAASAPPAAALPADLPPPAARSPSLYGYPSIYQQSGGASYSVIDDAFDEDTVVADDDTLVAAIEAVIAQPSTLLTPSQLAVKSNPVTRASSPRPALHHHRARRDREGSDATAIPIPHSHPSEPPHPLPASSSRSPPLLPPRRNPHVHVHVPEALLDVPRAECKKVLLGALEDVARQVADLALDDAVASRSVPADRETPLREGVSAWLKAVEDWA